ncbi:MAG: ABC transporter substrate-binding protein [Pseudoflavonifractor sp.]
MNKKKLLALAVAAALTLSLAACGAPAAGGGSDKYTIGIIQLVEHPALDAATEGFKAAVTEKLGDKVEFIYQNAQNDTNNCTTIVTKFVSDKVDLIMANATPAVQAAASATGEIPVVGTSVTDYKVAGVVESSEKPGRNVTGVSDLPPIDQQIALFLKLCPDLKTVGILYCSSEQNSVYQAEQAQKELEAAGKTVKVYTVADSNEIQAVVSKAAEEVDGLYVPTDNTISDNIGIVKNITLPKRLPVFCGEEYMCGRGGLATLSISYTDVGRTAGEMACKILTEGAKPGDMPIQYVPDVVEKYNAEVAEAIGWTIPEGIEAIAAK